MGDEAASKRGCGHGAIAAKPDEDCAYDAAVSEGWPDRGPAGAGDAPAGERGCGHGAVAAEAEEDRAYDAAVSEGWPDRRRPSRVDPARFPRGAAA